MTRLFPLIACAVALICTTASAQTAAKPDPSTPRFVVSGFEPFGGRSQNASWITAQELKKTFPTITTLQIPVVWGAPLTAIESIKPAPDVWVAFGEGTRAFQIEILAHNKRGHSPDNEGKPPASPEIVTGADTVLENAVPAEAIAEALSKNGFPTHVSHNAGSYLCEEMLYSLLHSQKAKLGAFRLVLFVHVPVLGSELMTPPEVPGGPPVVRKVDAAFLSQFGKQLFAELDAQKATPK